MATLYLVRHGQASFGAANYDQLTPLGERQAKCLGAWWKTTLPEPGLLVCGSMARHQQTGQAFLDGLGSSRTYSMDAGFDEFDHQEVLDRCHPELANPERMGEYLYRADNPRREFQKLFTEATKRWLSGVYDDDYRESWRSFRGRAVAAMRRVLSQPSVEPIVVFTSGGVIAAICQELLSIPDEKIMSLNEVLHNTSVSKLLFSGTRVSLSSLNGVAHLEAMSSELLTYR